MKKNMCFVIPCKYSQEYGFLVENCVESIKTNHPNSDIFVVDSSSDTKEYAVNLMKKYGVKFLDIKNKNFSTGALWSVFDFYKTNYDYYFLLHDSTRLIKPIKIKQGLTVAPIMCGKVWKWPKINTVRGPDGKKIGPRSNKWATEQCKKNNVLYTENFNSLIGPMFLVSSEVLRHICKSGFYNIRPSNKHESETMERLWAMKFTNMNLGDQMLRNSFLGNFRQPEHTITICDKELKTHYISEDDVVQKFWIERQ